jgi:hypothetical protein
MIGRRGAIRLVVAAAALAAGWPPSAARAEQAFERFIPFMVDLPGWDAKMPEGAAMALPGSSMVTASREYHRGDARVIVAILIGPAARSLVPAKMEDFEAGVVRGHASSIDGLRAMTVYKTNEDGGVVAVPLADSAVFTLVYFGIAEDEALVLARRFALKAMQAAVAK